MAEPVLVLHATGLASKYGFSDGDLVRDFVLGLVDDGWVDPEVEDWLWDSPDREALVRLVRDRLVPAIPAGLGLELLELGTTHNPIRASRVDGLEVATGTDERAERLLEPYSVEVPWRDVIRLAGLEVVVGEVLLVDDVELPAFDPSPGVSGVPVAPPAYSAGHVTSPETPR